MPTYTFKCPNCGGELEERMSVSEYCKTPKPFCGEEGCIDQQMRTQLQATATIFKGAGWTPKFEGGAGLGPSVDMAMPKRVKRRGKSS